MLPLWVLIAASALQLIPELRGEWMFDPLQGTIEFVEFGFFAQWFRGGVIATGMLGLAAPLLGVVVLIATGANAVGRRRSVAETLRYEGAAGESALDVPLVVRKRKRGSAEAAIPVSVVEASPLRRLLAKLTDLVLLVSCGGGGALVGILATVGTIDWGGVAWSWPILGALFSAAALSTVQWAGVVDRGQTLGKILFDIRAVELERDVAASWVPGVLLRHVFPEGLSALVAMGIAAGAAKVAVLVVNAAGLADLFIEDALTIVVALAVWPVAMVALELLRSVPLLFGRTRTLHDRLAATRVVRTAVGEADSERPVPLGFRMLARVLDGALTGAFFMLPVAAAAVLQQGFGGQSGSVMAVGVFAGALLAASFEIWQWVSLARTGTTIGKRRIGLRVERVDGLPPSLLAFVIVREWVGVGFLSALLPGIWLSVDAAVGLGDDGRCGHDRLANTRVVWASAPEASTD